MIKWIIFFKCGYYSVFNTIDEVSKKYNIPSYKVKYLATRLKDRTKKKYEKIKKYEEKITILKFKGTEKMFIDLMRLYDFYNDYKKTNEILNIE